MGKCVPSLCNPLEIPDNGFINPPDCAKEPQKGGVKCTYGCKPGYKLEGRKSTTCSKRKAQWKKRDQPQCTSEFPKPFILCPSDITKPLSGRSSSVYVMIPQPKTNVDWFRYVDAEPSWAKQLEGEMTRGRHVITFRARSPMASVSATCQMIIHVKDMEAPRVQKCPQSFSEILAPGQSTKKVTWIEPVFSDNVKIQHVMASFLPGHYFSAGKHNILYTATDADGNRAKCGFTITVHKASSTTSNGNKAPEGLPPPSKPHSHRRHSFKNHANIDHQTSDDARACDTVPNIENGRMLCRKYGLNGKKCSPTCNQGHQFYQKFVGQPPVYLCLPPKRIDWKIRKFIPDCAPVHDLPISGRKCEAGWERRGRDKCVACPPGMYRPQEDPLCKLCPKGLYSDQFGSANCVRCPLYHTTKGLGSRKASQCYYHRPAARSGLLDRRKPRNRDSVEASFMFYNRWMTKNRKNNVSK